MGSHPRSPEQQQPAITAGKKVEFRHNLPLDLSGKVHHSPDRKLESEALTRDEMEMVALKLQILQSQGQRSTP